MIENPTKRKSDAGRDACPKRAWVLNVLSDDEQHGPGDRLPQGLRFHLSRCEQCRLLADRLRSTVRTLAALADDEPEGAIFGRADRRCASAIRDGGISTGRVNLDDVPDPLDEDHHAATHFPARRYLVAASVVFAALLSGAAWLIITGNGADKLANPASLAGDGSVRVPHDRGWVARDGSSVGPVIAPDAEDPVPNVGPGFDGAVVDIDGHIICHHRTAEEAAECERCRVLHRAILLPACGTDRDRSPTNAFDAPPSAVSDERHRDGG